MKSESPEVSVVMPCLDEADTIRVCIEKAYKAFKENGIDGEIIVADNGSMDDSVSIAEECGARIIHVKEKGYGNALMGGINASNSQFIIMGDADDSYNWLELNKFLEKLREGYDLVQGCRLPTGGGKINPGAMPFSHRWIGNPLFSYLVRKWFKAPISDVWCGMRGFTKVLYKQLGLRCTGMEFATEMIIRATLDSAKISEVPITLHKDGRTSHAPHLRTIRDGWRTLRFFLMYSPRWLYLIPGLILISTGGIGYLLALPGISIGEAILDVHTLLYSSLFILCGYQAILFALFTKIFAIREKFTPKEYKIEKFFQIVTLERGLIVSIISFILGISMLTVTFLIWQSIDFGELDYSKTMKWSIPGATLTAFGFQNLLASFFISILQMERK